MTIKMRTINPCRLNKGFGSKFPEDQRVQWLKCWDCNTQKEDNGRGR